MTDFIIKRSGEKVPFDRSKLEKWAEWAANNEVNWQEILDKALVRCPNGVTTKDFHKALIDTCTDTLDFNKVKMAARLLVGQLYKDVFGKFGIPDLKTFYKQMVKDALWEDMGYSNEELDILNKAINHNKDLTYSYTTVRQTIDKYLIKNKNTKQIFETPQFMFMGVAMMTMKDDVDNKVEKVIEWYNYLSDLKYNLPTPIANAWRTPFKSYASCAVLKSDDSADSIEAAQNIAYTMTTAQAGIGGYVDTRSAGDPVANGRVEHTGKLPYYRMFDTSVRSSKQLGRGGAMTMFYPCLDPEVETLLKLKNVKTPLDKRINLIDYGFQCNSFFWEKVAKQEPWMLVSRYYAPKLYELFFSSKTDEFEVEYNRVLEDNSIPKQIVKALDIAKSFMVNRQETGRIYPWWADTANKQTPFKDIIYSSNLCVAPETTILTKQGHLPIKDFEGEYVEIWNGEEFSNVKVVKTGENQKLIRIVTKDGFSLECTPYHKFYVAHRDDKTKVTTIFEKRAADLMKGDKLIKFDLPIIEGSESLIHAYANGFYSGDGCEVNGKQRLYFYHNKRKLIKYCGDIFVKWYIQENQNREYGETTSLQYKYFVPSCNYTISSRLEWLAGLLDSDGTLCLNGKTQSFQICSVKPDFLREVQMMLQTMGVKSKVTKNIDGGMRLMPANDGTGELKEFMCQTSFRLLIGNDGVSKLQDLGLKTYRLEPTQHRPNRECSQFIKIESVEDHGRYDDTYCFTEPKRNLALFNGILTGQCAEIDLPTKGYENSGKLYKASDYSGEVAMCNLGAYVLNTEDTEEDIEKIYYYGVKLTDKTISEMKYPLESIAYTANMRRSIGIGLTNLAYVMAKSNLSYSSKKGKEFIHSIAERHSYYLHKASLRLGKELGNAPWISKTKYPEGWFPFDDSSKLLDKLDLDLSLKYDWETLRKEIIENKGIRNSVLEACMPVESSSQITNSTNGLYPVRELVIVKRSGSNTNIFFAPEYDNPMVRYFYESAYDVPPKDLLECYALVQKHTGQGISADTYIDLSSSDAKMSMKEQIELMIYATQLGLKSLYYMNTRTDADTTEESCESCKM